MSFYSLWPTRHCKDTRFWLSENKLSDLKWRIQQKKFCSLCQKILSSLAIWVSGNWKALIYWPKPGFTGPNNWHNTVSTKFPHASGVSGRALSTGPIGNWLANGIGLISQTKFSLLFFLAVSWFLAVKSLKNLLPTTFIIKSCQFRENIANWMPPSHLLGCVALNRSFKMATVSLRCGLGESQ